MALVRLAYTVERSSVDRPSGERSLASGQRVIEFDAVVSVAPESTATLTERAVEGGVSADHKRPEQDRITVEAWVTNTPLDGPPPGGLDVVISADSIRQDTTNASVIAFSSEFDRVRGVVAELRRLAREPISITLSTPMREYEAVQLVSVAAPTTTETGVDAVSVVLEFVEVEIVETRDTEAPLPREPRGARRGNRGAQQGAEDDAENAERNASALHDLVNSDTAQTVRSALGL